MTTKTLSEKFMDCVTRKHAVLSVVDGPSVEALFASLRYAYPEKDPRCAAHRVHFRFRLDLPGQELSDDYTNVWVKVIGLTYEDGSGASFILDVQGDPLGCDPRENSSAMIYPAKICYDARRRTGVVTDVSIY